jgi:hypothetical protein
MSRNQINLHHANLLIGGREEAQVYLDELTSSLDFKLANNPDFFPFRMDVFGIDEARQLKFLSARKPLGACKIFLISPMAITPEAQNALLKTFEDPMPDTIFFLVIREQNLIEPTLLSRMQSMHLPKGVGAMAKEAKDFINLAIKDRLLFAKKFADEEGNLAVFLDSLLSLLKKSGSKESLEKVFNIRKLIRETMPLPRLVLEHLALML